MKVCNHVAVTRLDTWLWAVRLFRTRTQATTACRGGHVRVNGAPIKAAYSVKIGDEITIRLPGWERKFQVTELITKRVGALIAAKCYVDLSPQRPAYLANPTAKRDRGAGRPTKKQRRAIDQLRGRDAF